MATTTSAAPITIPQINRYYYVGEPMLRTIQQAVTFAVADNNAGTVIIPQEYAGTDSPTVVTGGSATVFIVDERRGQRQAYIWYSNAYVAEPITPPGIGTPQLNHNFFVGPLGKFPTIQSAITGAVTLGGGKATVIITPTYAGSEDIATLTGGMTSVYLSDQRTAQWQNYYWNGTNYVPINFAPLGQIIANSITATSLTTSGAITAGGSIAAGSDITAQGDINIAGAITAGDATFAACIVDDSPVRTFANTADGPGEGMVWPEIGIPVSLGSTWQAPSIDPATLPYLGQQNLFTEPNAMRALIVTGQAYTDPVAAQPSGQFSWIQGAPHHAAALFGNSETATNGGVQLWGSNSTTSGAIIYLNCQPTGAIFGSNVSGYPVTVNGTFAATPNNGAGSGPITSPANGIAIGWNSQTGTGETDFVNSHAGGGGGFFWYNVAAGTVITPSLEPQMWLDSANNLNLTNNLFVAGTISAGGNIGTTGDEYVAGISHLANGHLLIGQRTSAILTGAPVICTDSTNLYFSPAANGYSYFNFDLGGNGVQFFDGMGGGTIVGSIDRAGNAHFNGTVTIGNALSVAGQLSVANAQLRFGARGDGGWSTGSPNINVDGASIIFNSVPGGSIFFNFDRGSAVVFGNGAGETVGMVDNLGNANFVGTLTAGVKSFRITYPHDDTKYLTHSCIEGPEIAVYYRGEAETHDGVATITLPHYFEGLTIKENRSIQLTELYDDDDDPVFGNFLAAGRIRDGKFNVRSSTPAVKFYWEVMAVRADVEPLTVVTNKEISVDAQPAPISPLPAVHPPVERSGTPQAGEPKPKTVRAGDAVATGSSRTRKPH